MKLKIEGIHYKIILITQRKMYKKKKKHKKKTRGKVKTKVNNVVGGFIRPKKKKKGVRK